MCPYELSSQLRAHEDDVRGICICGEAGIATSSRDRTVRFWTPDPGREGGFVLSKTLVGHSSFVGPVAWVPPSKKLPEGGVVSGGMDALVLLWDLSKVEVLETMKGHQSQVTGLVVADNGDIVSTSLDRTIRIWRNSCTVDCWEAHEAAVQAVVKLASGELVTGSSDATLKLWNGKTCVHTFKGHTDTVRGLALAPGFGILSASHDGSVRLWAVTGQLCKEMVGHTSLVYSVDMYPTTGLIASGSEDCYLKIWEDGSCVQSIEHPGCVWDAKFLPNGDIVTACSDGIVRIWTSDSHRVSERTEIDAYESLLSEYKVNRKKVGGINLSDLPGLEALHIPGTSNGQIKVIREGDNGVAYSWNSIDQKWDKIGEVVDGPGDGTNRTVHNGVQYDYVFDVDIGDGEPIRKLSYNRTDDPYTTADNWLLKENLPLSYREQVVQFILQNTDQKDFSLDTSYRDPYTGSSAYIPGEVSRTVDLGSSKRPTCKHIPKKGFLVFDAAQFDGILKKLADFNNAISSDPEQKHLALSELELTRLRAAVNILKDVSHYHVSTFADADIALIMKLLKLWPLAMLFPVIDIMRMLILHPDGANLLFKHIKHEDGKLSWFLVRVVQAPVVSANLLTGIRAIVNLFKHSCFHHCLQQCCSEILDALSRCRPSFNKNAHLAFATLLLNYAVLLIDKKAQQGQAQVLSAALEIAEDLNQDPDSQFRALVAIGSLMLDGLVKSVAIDFDVHLIAKAAKNSEEAKIAEVGEDIELLIKS